MAKKQNHGDTDETRYLKEVFSSRLREAMRKANLSQDELSKKLGVTAQMVSYYVTGKSFPSSNALTVIAKELNVSTDYLLGLTHIESNQPHIRMVGDYTGLNSDNIETLIKYQSDPLFTETVNFLFREMSFLEALADYLTSPFLEMITRPPYTAFELTRPYHDMIPTMMALDMHEKAADAQQRFAQENADNAGLREYVLERFISKYAVSTAPPASSMNIDSQTEKTCEKD